jgi:hypothetical protein
VDDNWFDYITNLTTKNMESNEGKEGRKKSTPSSRIGKLEL